MNILIPYSNEIYLKNLKNLVNFFKENGHSVQFTDVDIWDDLNKKPDLIISNQSWWNIEHTIGKKAKEENIPHISIEHGSPMFYQSNRQYYRKNIGAADYMLLWGQCNFDMMRRYKCSSNILKVTGNPRFDDLKKYKSVSNIKPRVLFLSTWKIGGEIKKVWNEVLQQSKILNYEILYKPHPMEFTQGSIINFDSLPENVKIIRDDSLFENIASVDIVITSPTSVLIPIFYYKKPIFSYYSLFTKGFIKGMYQFYKRFNIPHTGIGKGFDLEKILQKGINQSQYEEYFNYTSFKDDGNNSKRAYDFCLELTTK